MEHMNVKIINKFFEAYGRHDLNGISETVSDDVRWVFPGQNSLSGTKVGIEEVVLFFDKMGELMGKSKVEVKRLVMGASDEYVVESQHIHTNREDGINLDQEMCVLWRFKDGKIIEGKHFVLEQIEADNFFNKAY